MITSPSTTNFLRRCYELQTRGAPELHLGHWSVSAFLRAKESIDSRIDRGNSNDVVVFEAGVPGCVLYADLLPLPLSVTAAEQPSKQKDPIVGGFTLRPYRQRRNSIPREFYITGDDGSAAYFQTCRELVVRGLFESAELVRRDSFIYERPDGLFVQHRHKKATPRCDEQVESSLLTPDLRVRCSVAVDLIEWVRLYSVTPVGCTFLERAQKSDDDQISEIGKEEWSPPMSKAEAARRIIGDHHSRFRKVEPLLRGQYKTFSTNKIRIRLDGLDKLTRQELTAEARLPKKL